MKVLGIPLQSFIILVLLAIILVTLIVIVTTKILGPLLG
jgi:hypothetical protein